MTHIQYTMYIPKYPMHPYLKLRERLLDLYDGLTESPMSVGAWRNYLGKYVQEGVSVMTVLVHRDNATHLEYLLQQYKDEAKQECVLYTTQSVNAAFI